MYERVRLVQQVNESLRRWESTIPAELRPGSFSTSDSDHQVDSLTRIFRLEALSLQLSYDNIQLIFAPSISVLQRDFESYSPFTCRKPAIGTRNKHRSDDGRRRRAKSTIRHKSVTVLGVCFENTPNWRALGHS